MYIYIYVHILDMDGSTLIPWPSIPTYAAGVGHQCHFDAVWLRSERPCGLAASGGHWSAEGLRPKPKHFFFQMGDIFFGSDLDGVFDLFFFRVHVGTVMRSPNIRTVGGESSCIIENMKQKLHRHLHAHTFLLWNFGSSIPFLDA